MSSFLSPLIATPDASFVLRNARTGRPLATSLEPAFDSASRRRGLLGRDEIADHAALIIAPCSSIHMFFMRFPIDVIFAAKDGRVVKVCSCVQPWRVAIALTAFAAIEIGAGSAARADTRPGDRLEIVPHQAEG